MVEFTENASENHSYRTDGAVLHESAVLNSERECTVGRRDIKTILVHLSVISSQKREKSKKVTENKQINKLGEKEGEWCIIKRGKREKKEVVNGARC